MKRSLLLILLLLAVFLLPTKVFAATGETSIQLQATVSEDSSCQVKVNATIHKDTPGNFYFSVPADATAIALNGVSVSTVSESSMKLIPLSDHFGTGIGDFPFTVSYTLRDVVHKGEDGALVLRLPLLCSSAYKVDYLRFSLTLPGNIETRPTFQSGYHQSNIEKDIVYSTNKNTITGSTAKVLVDHETLQLSLTVTEEMFPQPVLAIFSSDIDQIGMLVCAALALLYWIWKLRCLPPRRRDGVSLPEGLNAGLLGSFLTLQNPDLSLMVFYWARLGYIKIEPDRKKVILRKRMDMGNERSDFERKVFGSLFHKSESADCSGYRYALLSQKVAHTQPPVRHLVDKRSGNRRIFRVLTSLCGLFVGLGTGLALGFGTAFQSFIGVLFAFFGCFTAHHIQNAVPCLFLRRRRQLFLSCILAIAWIFFSLLSGRPLVGIIFVALEFLAGLMAYFGGRRTEDGKDAMAQILGFRRYITRVSRQSLEAISKQNPDYFFDLAPYALALGVGGVFARQFGTKPLQECPYIDFPLRDKITATKWNKIMEETLEKMDASRQQVPLREFSKKVQSLTR
ncbi:MAG: DUF2207 domain-containing protein [Ruminococcaceae bacterium]|nr:DUF2207 domain-containing protein [Oscillospiraceae bacterium]